MQNSTDPALFWIGLSAIHGVGRTTFRKLARHFSTPEGVLKADVHELRNVEGLSGKIIDAITSCSWHEHAEQELARARNEGVQIVLAGSRDYPPCLLATPDPPLFLYVKGSISQDERLAIVGTRKPTHYGSNVAYRIAYDIATAGLTVVSGMARGIDTQAHSGALAANGRTIAVLACGIDIVYPPENKGLLRGILRNGAVITENPFGTKPESGYFPARNRIISGLSQGTVIIEATQDSGSLITAKYTQEQGRNLFAVPGNISAPTSRGANSLIKEGAALVETAADILSALGKNAPKQQEQTKPLPAMSNDEAKAFERVTNEPKHIDSIMNEAGISAAALSAVMLTLELKGLVKQLPGKQYTREQ